MTDSLAILHCDIRSSWAGGQNQLLQLALRLRDRGHRQWILTRPGSPLSERAAASGFEILPHPVPGEIDPRGTWNLHRHIAHVRPDVVHAHDAHTLTLAALAARLSRHRPVVIGHRRVDFHIQWHVFSRWKYSSGADHLIAVSRRVKKILVEDGVPAERVTVVHSGIDLETPPPPPGPGLRERVGAPPGTPLIVTISTVADYKDHPTLIEAATRLDDRQPAAHWVVCGEGRLLDAMREEVRRRGLSDRVHYLGFVPGARGLLPEASVFVLSSKTEGLGTSVLDAMAAGIPVAATRAGGIPEMIEHETNGLLSSVGDADALAGAVGRLLDDPTLARRLADEARVTVADFDILRTVEATERVYRETLARRRPGTASIAAETEVAPEPDKPE